MKERNEARPGLPPDARAEILEALCSNMEISSDEIVAILKRHHVAEDADVLQDRYMARYIAKNIVAAGLAERCKVSLTYAIGQAEPVAVGIDTHGTGEYPDAALVRAVRAVFDLTPGGMIRALGLDRPGFAQFCNYGHFTHQEAPWEQTDRTEKLVEACHLQEVGVPKR